MKSKKLYELLAAMDLNECNGNFASMVVERISALCDIKNCELADLTFREVIGCFEAAQLDFNEQSPLLFNGHLPRPVLDIQADQLGAMV